MRGRSGFKRLRFGILAAACTLLLAGCAEFWEQAYRPDFGPVGKKHRPVLDTVWAQSEIGEGYLWHIYLRAHDP
ncbi:MAG: hypothetical protein V3V62_10730, partial [bacterium]